MLFLCSLCLAVQESFAQNSSTKDIVYLKNGSRLKGEIIHYERGGTLILKIDNGNELKMSDQTVERIVQEADELKKTQRVAHQLDTNKNPLEPKKWYHAFYFSGNLGGNVFDDRDWGVGIEHITGYWLNKNWGLGLGGGIVQYSSDFSWRVAPVFIDVKL